MVLLTASLAAGLCLAADDAGDPNGGTPKDKSAHQMISSSVKTSEKPIPRIWFGLTGSYTPLKLVTGNSNGLTNANGDVVTSTSANGLVGGGAILNFRLFHGYWLSLGSIYRFTGYDATDTLNDVNGTVFIERTRVRLIDFPLMLRYSGRKWNPSKYTFYEIGGVIREGFSLQTTTNATDAVTGELGAAPTTGTTFKHTVRGLVAGAGLIGKDDFGIIVSPEVRYTRWLGETFNSPIVGSQRNQLELTVSFGF
jgi:hypothetical protein